MSLGSAGLVQMSIGLAIVIFLIGRQFIARPLNPVVLFVVPLALLAFGAQSLLRQPATSPADTALLAINGALAIGLGVLRATSMRVWVREGGGVMGQGTWITFGFWLLTLATKLAITAVAGVAGFGAAAGLLSPSGGSVAL